MCRKMTLLARGGKCVSLGDWGSRAGTAACDSSPRSMPKATEPRPMVVLWRRARRVRDKCGLRNSECGVAGMSILGNRFVQVEQHLGDVEPGGPVGGSGAGGKFSISDDELGGFGVGGVALAGLLIRCFERRQ